jgi:hypothetical protein
MRKYPVRQNLDDLDLALELPEDLTEDSIQDLYKKWGLNPISWMHYFFPHYFQKPSPPFHYEIANNFLFSKYRKQAYEAPRGYAKTTLLEFLALHSIVFSEMPFMIFISQTEDIAADRLIDIRYECENNKTFRLFFGDLVSEKWGEKELILKNAEGNIHCKMLARGLGQQIIGSKYLEYRPQLIVIDDPEDIKIAENPRNVDKNERWLVKEVEQALSHDGRTFMISTPVTSDCLIERQKKRSEVYFRVFGAVNNLGVPIWPEHKNAEALAQLQKQLSDSGHLYIYFTEYLCNPISPDTHPFQEEMFEYYKPKDIQLEKDPFNIFMLIDLAIGEKKHHAFSALVVIAVDPRDTWYILDTHQVRSDWYEFAKDCYQYVEKWKPMAVGVEIAATQKGFWDVLRLTGEKHGWKPIVPLPVKPDADKRIRADRLLPRFKTHRVKFLDTQIELKKQLILHPDYPLMDLKDCLAYGELFCYPPGAVQPKEYKRENWRMGRAASDEEMDEEYHSWKQRQSDIEEASLGDLE